MAKVSKKQAVIARLGRHERDSGSPEVQIQLYLDSIRGLSRHLQRNPHDLVTKRVLLRQVARRKRMLHYLKQHSFDRYQRLIHRGKN